MSPIERILVTGASGRLGQLTLEALLKSGQKNLIATTREPDKLHELARQGVDVRSADFTDPASLAAAFKGATRLLLISATDIGARVEQHKNAVTAAKAAGVGHIVYTSWPNPRTSPALVAPDHAATEKIIDESGLKHTVLRNYLYAQNLMFSLPGALESGTLYGCAGEGKAAYVTREDCANAAAGALVHASRHENARLNVSGSKAYSHAELAALLGEIKHKPLVYQDLAPEAYKAAVMKSGLPEMAAQIFVSIDLAIKNGDVATVTDAVEELSGKAPTSLPEFLRASLK